MYMSSTTNTSTFTPSPVNETATASHLRQLSQNAEPHGSNVGTIVAIVIMAVMVSTLLSALGWHLWRQRKQRAQWDYAQTEEFDDVDDDMKPYIITPYIVPTSRSGSPAPNARSHSPESELEVAVLPYDAASPSHRASTAHMDDPDAWSEIVMYEQEEEHECTKGPSPADASRVTSPTASDTPRQITALEPTRLSGEYAHARPSTRTSSLALATAGLASVADGLKEKTKRKRKSRIQSVPRPQSFCIDKSRTGHSPMEGTSPLPSWSPPPLPSPLSSARCS
ncbi:hypothetical protein FOMPIDRAFT_92499 [Fomitopsis schrenkii]|uniref:Uncharacterized protein n=1 Tax=Fomitopsis schrenkii TaxID=2126942 RepID=S8F137_FOMSC|nr:hypothetical protein FOMPIDRAFT_92499 [Fomitopsis schrenkii]